MIKKKYDEKTKQLFKKILLFIDSSMISTINEKPEAVHKNLTSALISIRDVIFSEIVRDNQVEEILIELNKSDNDKKKLEESAKETHQETKSDPDQLS
jgi:hypothetical protein